MKPKMALGDFRVAYLQRAGLSVKTAAELHDALREAAPVSRFARVPCRLRPDGLSPISRRYIRASARKAKIR